MAGFFSQRHSALGSCRPVHVPAPDFLPFMSVSLEGRILTANRVTGASELFDRVSMPDQRCIGWPE
jgi:hypothetical protein